MSAQLSRLQFMQAMDFDRGPVLISRRARTCAGPHVSAAFTLPRRSHLSVGLQEICHACKVAAAVLHCTCTNDDDSPDW